MDFTRALQQHATSNVMGTTNHAAVVAVEQTGGQQKTLQHHAILPGGRLKLSDQTLEDVSPAIPGPSFLRNALHNCESPLEFITNFQRSEGIRSQTISAPIALMDLHGITRLTFHEHCYDRVLERLCKQIDLLTLRANSGIMPVAAEINDNAATDGVAGVAVDAKTKNKAETEKAARQQLEKFLEMAFPFANVPRMRPVVLHLLRNTPSLPDKYRGEIAKHSELYQICDISVKRQIWLERRDLFEKEIDRHISIYIDKRRRNMFDLSKRKGMFGTFSAERRADADFRTFIDMIGRHEKLYRYVRSFVTKKFLVTLSGNYATLRADLIFAVHERQPELEPRDAPVYKMAWMLEELAMKAHLDSRSADELIDILRQLQENATVAAAAAEKDNSAVEVISASNTSSNKKKVGKGKAVSTPSSDVKTAAAAAASTTTAAAGTTNRQHGQNLHDAAFLLTQPNVLFALGLVISRAMEACLHHDELPKNQKLLMVALRLLNLACYSPIMLGRKEKRSREPEFDESLVQAFMPAMLAAVVDGQLERLQKVLAPEAPPSTTTTTNKAASSVHQLTTQAGLMAQRTKPIGLDIVFDSARESPTAVYIFLNFIGVTVKLGYFRLASQCIKQLPHVFSNIVLENDYLLHYLIILLGFGLQTTAAATTAVPSSAAAASGKAGSSGNALKSSSASQQQRRAGGGAFPTWPAEFIDMLFKELLGKELEVRLQQQNGSSDAEATTTNMRDRARPMHIVRHILVCLYLIIDRIPPMRRESLLEMVEQYCQPVIVPPAAHEGETVASNDAASAATAAAVSKNGTAKTVTTAGAAAPAAAESAEVIEKNELAEMYRLVAKRIREKVGGAARMPGVGGAQPVSTKSGGAVGRFSGFGSLASELNQDSLPIDIPGL